MVQYEYKVVPAPTKGLKAKGVRTAEGRFANSVQSVLNRLAGEGWEYLRAELLPSEERSGLTGSTTKWRNVLVFRRAIAAEVAEMPDAQPDEFVEVMEPEEEEPAEVREEEQKQKEAAAEELSLVAGMITTKKPAKRKVRSEKAGTSAADKDAAGKA